MIRELPPDLSTLDERRLEHAIDERDARVAALFRRWPGPLSAGELHELRRLVDERQRLARYVGRLRRSVGSR